MKRSLLQQAVESQYVFEHRSPDQGLEYSFRFQIRDIDKVYSISPESIKFSVLQNNSERFYVEVNGDIKNQGRGFLFVTKDFGSFLEVVLNKADEVPSLTSQCCDRIIKLKLLDSILPIHLHHRINAKKVYDNYLEIPPPRW